MPRLLAALLLMFTTALGAQENRTVIRVIDIRSEPVPYALVTLRDGVSRVADDAGRAVFNEAPKDSVRVQVRRIGYDPFFGWVAAGEEGGDFTVAVRELPRSIQALQVTERANTPLGRSGFYDRVARVQAGAYSARMITPEELELRNPIRLTQMLAGENLVRVQRYNGDRSMLTGRGGTCGMTILLDGQRVSGTLEELLENRINPPPASTLMSIDDFAPVNSLAAIEIYGSVNSIPAELQRSACNVQCGLIALWTGRRR